MAAALADIDGDARPLVLVVFDRFDLALPHADVLAYAFRHLGVGRGGPAFHGVVDDKLGQGLELVAGITELGA